MTIVTRWAAIALLCLLPTIAGAGELRSVPDPAITPGAVNPDVTQDTISTTICVSGWTKTVRPPVSYTNALKRAQMTTYGYDGQDLAAFEEDHFIPIEIGGHPTDPRNLWPQPWDGIWGARVKDRLETHLKRLTCAGSLSLTDAQSMIRDDWREAYTRYFGQPDFQATTTNR